MIFQNFSERWNLLHKGCAFATDNASEMAPEMIQLLHQINSRSNNSRTITDFHVRRIAYVVNLAEKDCLQIVHLKTDSVRGLLSSIRSSVKRLDMYESIQNSVGIHHELLCLDARTRWFSTFDMIHQSYMARSVPDKLTPRSAEMQVYAIKIDESENVSAICNFSSSAPLLTEY